MENKHINMAQVDIYSRESKNFELFLFFGEILVVNKN